MVELGIRCSCGSLGGRLVEVAPATVNRVVCYCAGCRRWAEVLDRADEMLDARGGAEVIQVSPRRLVLDRGRDTLERMQLSEGGAARWSTRCCRTPLAHTFARPRLPFLAVHHLAIDWTTSERARDELVGPIRARVNGEFTPAEARAARADTRALVAMIGHYLPLFCAWTIRGDARRSVLRS